MRATNASAMLPRRANGPSLALDHQMPGPKDQGTTMTTRGDRLRSFCETLPSSNPVTRPVPRLPTAIASASTSSAIPIID